VPHRLSLLHFKGRFLLYARANPATHSQRFVQMTSSADTVAWDPFRMIALDGYAHAEGNIYFFSAQVLPALPRCPQYALGEHLDRSALYRCASRAGESGGQGQPHRPLSA
jgi:hypothetical protein